MTNLTVSALLFDLDNTLFDRDRAFRRWANNFVRTGLGLCDAAPCEEARGLLMALDARGYGSKTAMFTMLTERYPALGESIETLVEAFYRQMPAFATLDDDAAQFLDALQRADLPFGIVTNGTRHQHAMVEALGLDRRASCVFVSETFGARKPEAAIFLAAAAALCVEPRDALFVGDNPEADIAGAYRAGIRTAWLRRGQEWPASLPPACIDVTIDSLGDLTHILFP